MAAVWQHGASPKKKQKEVYSDLKEVETKLAVAQQRALDCRTVLRRAALAAIFDVLDSADLEHPGQVSNALARGLLNQKAEMEMGQQQLPSTIRQSKNATTSHRGSTSSQHSAMQENADRVADRADIRTKYGNFITKHAFVDFFMHELQGGFDRMRDEQFTDTIRHFMKAAVTVIHEYRLEFLEARYHQLKGDSHLDAEEVEEVKELEDEILNEGKKLAVLEDGAGSKFSFQRSVSKLTLSDILAAEESSDQPGNLLRMSQSSPVTFMN